MSFAAILLVAASLGAAAVSQPPDSCRDVMGHMINGNDTRTTIVVSDRDRCLEVRIVGRVTFSDDDADVRALEGGGSLVATDTRGGETRTLTLVEHGGAIDRAYRVNGTVRPAAESASWFAGVVLEIVRGTGYGAPERVARIRRQRGVRGVLDEVEQLRSDHIRRIYLEELLASGAMSTDELRRVARLAAERIGSDHEKATVLLALLDHRGDDRAATDAVLDAASTLGSDHERANVLLAAIDGPTSVLPAARGPFFPAVDLTGSDHERRRVLEALATRASLGDDTLRALLASASRIGSDHEKAAVLLAIAARPERLRDSANRAAFDAALRSIGSDAEYRRVSGVLAR